MSTWTGRPLLWCAVVLMMLGAGFRLSDEFHRLVFDQGQSGAIDLGYRYEEVAEWFAGGEVYGAKRMAVYPPASYALMWPFLGWLTWPAARLLWAATTVVAVGSLIALALRALPGASRLERAAVVFLVLSVHGTGGTIGNGQLLLHVLPALVAGTLLLGRQPATLAGDTLIACAFTWAAVKPNAAVPFMVLVLVLPGRLRPAIMVVAGYLGLTIASVAYRTEPTMALMRAWLRQLDDVDVFSGYGDAHSWLTQAGLPHLRLVASIAIMGMFGLWLWRRRDADIWNLLGVAAIVARTFAYHRPYDDALMLLPMIALARIVVSGTRSPVAAVLLTAVWLGAIAPAHYVLYYAPFPVPGLFHFYQAVVWLATLGYLAGWREPPAVSPLQPPLVTEAA